MEENGLFISEKEFLRLRKAEQMGCLYQNQVKQFQRFDQLEKIIKGYRFHQKIQYFMISALWATVIGGGAWIINQILN